MEQNRFKKTKKPPVFHDVVRKPRPASSAAPSRPSKRSRTRYSRFFLLGLGLVVFFVLALVGSFKAADYLDSRRYSVSPAVKELVGKSVPELNQQLTFDKQKKEFQYNPDAAKGPDQPGDAIRIGGSKYYGVSLAQDAEKGQTVYDAKNVVDFSMRPQFDQLNGKRVDGMIVYPFDKGQVIYTLKDDGLKEDIVISNVTKEASFTYKLGLPDNLMAQLNKDGTVGIYSISAESTAANIAAKVSNDGLEKPQKKPGELRFLIPKPVVVDSSKKANGGQAWFEFKDEELTVHAKNLEKLQYPISIDPSVVVSSTNTLSLGNNEDNSQDISSGSLIRQGTSNGSTGTWLYTNDSVGGLATQNAGGTAPYGLNTNRYDHRTVTYNNMVFAIAGSIGGSTTPTVEYAEVNSNGTLTAWSAAQSINQTVDSFAAAGYNGYLYVFGGQQGGGTVFSRVEYAKICTGQNVTTTFSVNCSLGAKGTTSWCTSAAGNAGCGTAPAPSNMQAGTMWGLSATAYNGYMYLLGGCDLISGGQCNSLGSRVQDDAYYAKINLDGTLGAWTTQAASLPSNRAFQGTFTHNGYIYLIGGCVSWGASFCTTSTTAVHYATLNSDGSIGGWTASASTVSFVASANNYSITAVATRGYVYLVGGNTINGDVKYAPIFANGDIGAVNNLSNTFTTTRHHSSLTTSRGYLYVIAGCTTNGGSCQPTNPVNDVQYAQIDSYSSGSANEGQTSAGTVTGANTYFSASGRYTSGAAAYNGYLYNVGGCTTTNCSAVATASYAAVCTKGNTTAGFGTVNCSTSSTAGTTSSWKAPTNLPAARYGSGVAAYNGYLYVAGGCIAGSLATCTGGQYGNTVQVARICTGSNTDGGCSGLSMGDIGTWSNYTFGSGTGRWGLGLGIWSGRLYLIGGTASSGSLSTTIEYATVNTSGGGLSDWQSVAGPSIHGVSATTYNGYLYYFGGVSTPDSYSGMSTTGQYAQINSNGTIGSFSATSAYSGTATTGMGLAAASGYMYLIGGSTGASGYTNTTRYAPIQASGVIGTWTAGGNLTANRKHPTAVISNGYLYGLGGFSATTTLNTTNEYISLKLPDKRASYSIGVDTSSTTPSGVGSQPQVTRFGLASANTSAWSGCVTYGLTTMTLGVKECTQTSSLNLPTSVVKTKSRYVFAFVTLDDSQTALATDTNPSTGSSLNLYFRAASDRRLRGGKTFTDMNTGTSGQNTLDTEQ